MVAYNQSIKEINENWLWQCVDSAQNFFEVTLEASLPEDYWKEIGAWGSLVKCRNWGDPSAEYPCPAYCANCVSPFMQSASDQSHRKEASCTFPRIASLFLAWPTEAQGTALTGGWPWAQSLHHVLQLPISSRSFLWSLYFLSLKQYTVSFSCLYFSLFLGHIKIKQVECLDLHPNCKTVVRIIWCVLSQETWRYLHMHWANKILQIFFW